MQTEGQTQPLIRSWPLWVLMLLSLALATPLAYVLNIRFDEAFTLNTTLDGPVYAVKQALGFGQQAPLYTQYYIGFQLFAGAVALLACRKWRPLGQYVLHMAVAGVIFIPMIVIVASGQMGAVTDQIDAKLSFGELVNGLYQRIIPLMVPVNAIEHETLKRWLARGVIAGIVLLFSAKVFRERKNEDIALCATIAVMALFSLFAYSIVGDQLIQQRHLSGMILPLVIIPLAAVSFLRSKPLIDGWVALVIGLSVFFLFTYYKPLAKPGDFERMGKFVMENEVANQPVLIFHADAILPFRYYYKGQNKMLPLPQENGTDVWNPRNNVIKDEAQILNVLNSQPGSPDEFWLVDDGWCAHGTLKFNCEILEGVVDKYFVVESRREFFPPATVRLLKRK